MNTHKSKDQRRSFACDVNSCNFIGTSKESLKIHKTAQHFKNQLYECPHCQEQFQHYHMLYRHKKVHSTSEEADKYVCQFCRRSFSGAAVLRDHILTLHTENKPQLSCPVQDCNKISLTTKQLRNHIKSHHTNDAKEVCYECGIQVRSKTILEKHIRRIHLNQKNFICDVCGYRGFFKFNIVNHIKIHLENREKLFCSFQGCNHQSISKPALKIHHKNEHSGEAKKVYACFCGKEFRQNSSYYTHMRMVHEKIKAHACQHCDRSFYDRTQLKNHIKSQHLKKKDLECETCGKLFALTKHLRNHQRYHQPPKFKCEIEGCNNSLFYTSQQLNSHLKVQHQGVRDFACTFCDKKYFHKTHLKKHLLQHGAGGQ